MGFRGVPFEQETSEAPDGLAIRFLNVGRSEPCHRCVTHSRNQEDTERHDVRRVRDREARRVGALLNK
jgi:hypothetical protein